MLLDVMFLRKGYGFTIPLRHIKDNLFYMSTRQHFQFRTPRNEKGKIIDIEQAMRILRSGRPVFNYDMSIKITRKGN